MNNLNPLPEHLSSQNLSSSNASSTHFSPVHLQQWYAVARSGQLRAKPIALQVLDIPIALVRKTDGSIFALEDRCPHRHAPLSKGCVTASGLTCPYHGWSFDQNGLLSHIPGLPPEHALPAVRAKAFAVLEHDGIVWLKPSAMQAIPADAKAAIANSGQDIPSLARTLKPQTRKLLWHTHWQANIVDAMENFLDALHTHWIHPGLVRNNKGAHQAVGARQRMHAKLAATAEGFCVSYSGHAKQSGLLYRLFESPRTAELAHFAMPASTQIEYQYQNRSKVQISLHFTPCTATRTSVIASVHINGRFAPAWLVERLFGPFLRRVALQDARMLALQSENIARFSPVHGASTQLDLVRASLEQFWLHGQAPSLSRAVDLML
jgi:phenylpropionate dioxygenase-like ring-hydroxylating dioxygenase large terminal subunit